MVQSTSVPHSPVANNSLTLYPCGSQNSQRNHLYSPDPDIPPGPVQPADAGWASVLSNAPLLQELQSQYMLGALQSGMRIERAVSAADFIGQGVVRIVIPSTNVKK